MDKKQLKEATAHGTVHFPLAVYRWKGSEKSFLVKLHWHDEAEIVFFEQGIFLVRVNMQEYRVHAPAFLFVMPGEIHAIEAVGAGKESAVVFDLKMLSFEYFDDVQYRIIRPLLEGSIQLPQFIYEQDADWQTLISVYDRMQKESDRGTPDARIRVKACLYELLALFYEKERFQYAEARREYDTDKLADLKKILTYIQTDYGDKIAVQDMAKLLGMNAQYFCRYFKRLTGKTPNGYLNEIRVEKAAELLVETDRKIIDIAMTSGYDNMGYFIKRFTKQKGMSPSAYRKQNKKSI